MTAPFPALFDLLDDESFARNPIAFRVYLTLLKNDLIFFEPQAYKIWVLARELKSEKKAVIRALHLLIAKGYVLEHSRLENNVRQFTLTRIRNSSSTPKATPSAA